MRAEEMLRQMLADTDIRYEVNGNRIVVFHSAPTQQARGSFVLKGKVVDVHGEAVIGANIRVVDGTGGTITDVDGNFSLEVKPGDRIDCFLHRLRFDGNGRGRWTAYQCDVARGLAHDR